MNIGQSKVEHNLKILDSVIEEMGQRFHKYKSANTAKANQEDNDHLGMIAGKIGYLTNISAGATKTWNYEERIMELEKEKNNPVNAQVRKEFQFNPDIMLTVVRDNNGKIMN